MDLETFRALRTPAGERLLVACAGYRELDAVRLATRLRKDHPAGLVAAALTQASLRQQAAAKFGADAALMFFTRDGLEQATTRAVAEHRSRRLSGTVVDLCCGLGGDLLALARAGLAATGVDRDPLTVELARANLEVLGLAARVDQADVETYDRSPYDVAIADPARRGSRGRIFDPAAYSPPWSFVLALLAGDTCVKTAPIVPHRLVPEGVEADWVSERGEVKEAALWSGRFASARRRATVLPSGATLTDADDPGGADVLAPGAYLYEPDGAVVRAGLVTAVAPLVGGGLLHPEIAYLTSDELVTTPFATAYEVTDVLRYDERLLRKLFKDRGVGRLTVKKRGLDVDPADVRKRLVAKGPNDATLVLTRTPDGTVALLCESRLRPLPHSPRPPS